MGLQTVVYDCQVTCIFFMTGGFCLSIACYLTYYTESFLIMKMKKILVWIYIDIANVVVILSLL